MINLMKLFSYFILTSFIHRVVAVQINYIKVPSSVRNNTYQPIVMDCNYSVRPDDTDLVVKWFLNGEVVYQWIPPMKPQSLGLLRDRVDTSYVVSNDPQSMHRAMKILNPTTDIGGEYKCFVSTLTDEDFSQRKMIVFEPEKALHLLIDSYSETKVNFTCIASEIYPKPKLTIYRDKKDASDINSAFENVKWDTVKHEEDGSFTTFVMAVANLADLYPSDLINCELRIPSTGYVKRKSIIYYPKDMLMRNHALQVSSNSYGLITLSVLYLYL